MLPSRRAMGLVRYMCEWGLWGLSTVEIARMRHQSETKLSELMGELEDQGYMESWHGNSWYATPKGENALNRGLR